jgi:hypothetical protein
MRLGSSYRRKNSIARVVRVELRVCLSWTIATRAAHSATHAVATVPMAIQVVDDVAKGVAVSQVIGRFSARCADLPSTGPAERPV